MTYYLAAWRDGGVQALSGVFPGVLWIVPDPRRRQVVDDVARDLMPPDGMFRACTAGEAVSVMTQIDAADMRDIAARYEMK